MKKLRVGIIGTGGIARAHMGGYSKLDTVEMVAFCDAIPERAQQAAETFGASGAKVFTDYREMLEMKDLDAVSVCTPNNTHAVTTIAALKAGKHVFCEKPMAVTSAEADEMVRTARKNGLKLSVGYQSRFGDDAKFLKSMSEAGELGRIYYAEALSVRRRGVPTWGVFLSKEKQGGGPLIDIGTHSLDLTLWLMNDYSKPVAVLGSTYQELGPLGGYNAWGPWDPKAFEVEDSAFALIKLESGATVILKSSWALNIEKDLFGSILCGTQAGASLVNGELKISGQSHNRLWDLVPTSTSSKDSNYDREIAHWVDCLLNDKEPIVQPEQAAQVTRILEAIYKSSESGKAVSLA
ncbi:MAG TPA: Gfo/Idh/MocA family oxidoreductase [Firmicutes bacterium]|nr:Gfo/Idh/MocA family oxidoreductase [Bacillota bacterium]HHY99264.1 Gfo/Idh/MocA family oxidoreductase [Bacillota bacterium]